jgi:pSer/pThr/pTyr-binding forkhead associated (FHA) protein
MARLIAKPDGFTEQILELKLGVNKLGRSPDNDFQIEHPTISATHCHIHLDKDEVVISDLESTNGTFFRGEPVKIVRLSAGQTFRLGDVEVFVENTDVTVAIPKFELPRQAPPVVLTNGSMICPRHAGILATYRCTHCREIMCDSCVTRLRRRGGKPLLLCRLCSNKAELIGGPKKKKKGILGFLSKTVKMPFLHASKNED